MKSRKIWKTVLIVLGCALGAWAFGALLLPVLLPFFIGLAVSLLAEKPVRFLQTRGHVPRPLASGLCVLLLFGILFGGLFFLCRLLCSEAADLARQLPQLAENLTPLFERLKSRLLTLAGRLPDGLGTGLRAGVEEFFKTGAGFGTKLYETLFSWASGVIGRLPDAVLFAVTAILSSFMLSGELPAIRSWLRGAARVVGKIADARRTCARDARRLASGAAEADGHYIFDSERRAFAAAGALSGAGSAGHHAGRCAAGVRYGHDSDSMGAGAVSARRDENRHWPCHSVWSRSPQPAGA